MKTTIINPDAVREFLDKNKPAIITISRNRISFNRPAGQILALKKGTTFLLIHEDDKFYYQDSTTGFEINIQSDKLTGLQVSGILQLIQSVTKETANVLRFTVGELANGRRLLKPYTE